MWLRLIDCLACPLCKSELTATAIHLDACELEAHHIERAEELGIRDERFSTWIETGLLRCHSCRTRFPILHGLPVLVPYRTPAHDEFASENAAVISGDDHQWPSAQPVPGEQFVLRSFSREWLDYDYDGVLWDLSYEDRERMFLAEVGQENLHPGTRFLEIGCGLGLITSFAHKHMRGDAIGLDLSLAVLPATAHFRTNPFLHFVEASLFFMPLREALADVVYSHGVLHHTYSTEAAFAAIVPYCRDGGLTYVWLYGPGSRDEGALRRLAYRLESEARPVISRNLDSPLSRAFLYTVSTAYLGVNAFHRLRDRTVAAYDFRKALHAAQDRFTPLFAHRQGVREVSGYFTSAGFVGVEPVDWRTMPTATQDNYRRNVGVRGKRPAGRP